MESAWWGAGSSSGWGVAAAVAVCAGVALAAALVLLSLRHRRLARSFLRFTAATPRYDSRRGQATIDNGILDFF